MQGATLNRIENALGVTCSCGSFVGSQSCRVHNSELLTDAIEAAIWKLKDGNAPTEDDVARLKQYAKDLESVNAGLEAKNDDLEERLEDMRRPFTERLLELARGAVDRIVAAQERVAAAAERQAVAAENIAEIQLRSGR